MIKSHRRKQQQGQSLVEYGLILVIVALVAVIGLGLVGPALNRGLAVAVGGLKGRKNAGGAPVAGSSNIIYVDVVPPSAFDNGSNGVAGMTVCTFDGTSRFVAMKLQTSADIGQTDFLFTLDSKILPATFTGGSGAPWYVTVWLSAIPGNRSVCPQSVVITAKKALAIAPVIVY